MVNTSLSRRHNFPLPYRHTLCRRTMPLIIKIGCRVLRICLSSTLVIHMRSRHSSVWDSLPTIFARVPQWLFLIYALSHFPVIKKISHCALTCALTPSLGLAIGSTLLVITLFLSPRWTPDGRMALIILTPDLHTCHLPLSLSILPGRYTLTQKLQARPSTSLYAPSPYRCRPLDFFFCLIIGHRGHPSTTTLRSIRFLEYTLFQVDRGLVSQFHFIAQDLTIILGLYYFPHCCRSALSEHASYSSVCCCQHFQPVII